MNATISDMCMRFLGRIGFDSVSYWDVQGDRLSYICHGRTYAVPVRDVIAKETA